MRIEVSAGRVQLTDDEGGQHMTLSPEEARELLAQLYDQRLDLYDQAHSQDESEKGQ